MKTESEHTREAFAVPPKMVKPHEIITAFLRQIEFGGLRYFTAEQNAAELILRLVCEGFEIQPIAGETDQGPGQ